METKHEMAAGSIPGSDNRSLPGKRAGIGLEQIKQQSPPLASGERV